jgi:hypothetical protein
MNICTKVVQYGSCHGLVCECWLSDLAKLGFQVGAMRLGHEG